MKSYWDKYPQIDEMFWHGVAAGVMAYAYWKDGKQYVGTTGKTLNEALEEIEKKQYEAAKARARKRLYERDHSGILKGEKVEGDKWYEEMEKKKKGKEAEDNDSG